MSKTRVDSCDEGVRRADGSPLTLGDGEQQREFFRLRRLENNEVDFTYPEIAFTVSHSDLVAPLATSTGGGY